MTKQERKEVKKEEIIEKLKELAKLEVAVEAMQKSKDVLLSPILLKLEKLDAKLQEGAKLIQDMKFEIEQLANNQRLAGEPIIAGKFKITYRKYTSPEYNDEPSIIKYLTEKQEGAFIKVKEAIDKNSFKDFYEREKAKNPEFEVPGFEFVEGYKSKIADVK